MLIGVSGRELQASVGSAFSIAFHLISLSLISFPCNKRELGPLGPRNSVCVDLKVPFVHIQSQVNVIDKFLVCILVPSTNQGCSKPLY